VTWVGPGLDAQRLRKSNAEQVKGGRVRVNINTIGRTIPATVERLFPKISPRYVGLRCHQVRGVFHRKSGHDRAKEMHIALCSQLLPHHSRLPLALRALILLLSELPLLVLACPPSGRTSCSFPPDWRPEGCQARICCCCFTYNPLSLCVYGCVQLASVRPARILTIEFLHADPRPPIHRTNQHLHC
jgi:hypothetical protein